MYRYALLSLFLVVFNCNGQNATESNSNDLTSGTISVGGPFENWDLIYVDMPKRMTSVDTSQAWNEKGEKLRINGRILQMDGRRPAPNVTLYYYHTNTKGIYPKSDGLNPKAERHGYIRGWVKTDKDGRFTIYTIRPGSYPNSSAQAHIHPTIKEPNNLRPYYIDDFVFDDDPNVTDKYRNNQRKRGGSGILKTKKQGDLWVAEHTIILGLNIPDYPK